MDEIEKQMYKRPFELPIESESETGNALIDTLLFDPHPIRGAFQMRLAKRDATELALALERFRRSTGELPLSLDELVPDFIAQVPVDPITGSDMLYFAEGVDFRIYSVGLDKDDDGGEPVVIRQSGGQSYTEFNFYYDGISNSGDWLLWPRVPESSN